MTDLPPGASPVDAIAAGTRLREWEVVRFVGRGSYGVVFEARRSSWLDEPTRALKVFDPIVSSAARAALLDEFATLTRARHPHLLAGIDAFDLVDPPFAGCVVFVLELADEDLAHRVARAGPLPPATAAGVIADVADGLAALHAEGRIHGDVKPENILRVGDRWTLGDFGVTSVLEGSYAVTRGATIDYRSPEQAHAAEGSRQHRSADVWALGVSLHVAATGRHPFPGPDPMMRFAAVVRGERLAVPGLDPGLAAVIDGGCLVPDPHGRFDAASLAARLRALAAGPPAAPGPDAGPVPPGGPPAGSTVGAPPAAAKAIVPPRGVPSAGSTVGAEGAPGLGSGPVPPPGAPPAGSTAGPPSAAAKAIVPPRGVPSAGSIVGAAPLGTAGAAVARPGAPAAGATAGAGVPAGGPPGRAHGEQPAPWWVAPLVAGLLTLVATQVVAVVCGAVLDGLTARRAAYLVVTIGLVAGGLAAYRARAGAGVGDRSRPAPVAPVAAAALAVWLVATIALFV